MRTIRVEQGNRQSTFHALFDSGNGLRDPVSGAKVLVASPRALSGILGENVSLFESLGAVQLQELSMQIPELSGRLRLLPFSAVGGKGLLPVFRPDHLFIEGQERRDYLIAISPQTRGDGFDAII